jgi:hypothetical protein
VRRDLVAAATVDRLTGRRVVWHDTKHGRYVDGLVAVSSVFVERGRPRINVVTESTYWAWVLTGVEPEPQAVPAGRVWVEGEIAA